MRTTFIKHKKGKRIRDLSWKNSVKMNVDFVQAKLYDKHDLVGTAVILDYYVCMFVINPKYRNQGYGSYFINEISKYIFKKYKEVWLEPENEELISFYLKNGFKEPVPEMFEGYNQLQIMKKYED